MRTKLNDEKQEKKHEEQEQMIDGHICIYTTTQRAYHCKSEHFSRVNTIVPTNTAIF
jgi:hypothetical protein